MERLIERAEILVEALPYIQRFRKRTIVIKYGGAAMTNEELKAPFALDILLLQLVGIRPVVVHGGGPMISRWLDRLDIPSEFVNGMRVTSAEAMEVVEMVLTGGVNRRIVRRIEEAGGRAVGLSGIDGGLVEARKIGPRDSADGPRDMGQVGEVVKVNPEVLETLEGEGFVPVIASIAPGEDGQSLNLNADILAGEIAAALDAEKLVLLTDVAGVQDKAGERISATTAAGARALMADVTVSGGMIPKLECCIEALERGVRQAHIIDGRVKHALLLELFTDEGIGTLVSKEEE